MRQRTSAYVSIRQHQSLSSVNLTAAYKPHASAYVSIRQHTSAYGSFPASRSGVSIRQHTSAYVSIRQHTTACLQVAAAYALGVVEEMNHDPLHRDIVHLLRGLVSAAGTEV
jgi:hypothetical protein